MQIKKSKDKSLESLSKYSSLEIAELLVCYLQQLNIDYVFGIPGGAIEPLYNALAKSEREGKTRAIVARHECGAAFMAAGYASNTNKIGVCCATTGPGATNLLTGVASAYENNIPLLVITPQTTLANFGKKALQESSCTGVDVVSMYKHCTVYSSLVSHIDQFETKLCAALLAAHQESKPAHLSIPLDIQRTNSQISKPSFSISKHFNSSALVDKNSQAELETLLLQSKNVVFVVGDGAKNGVKEITSLAHMMNAKLITTPHGKSLINPYNELYRGTIGFAGHSSALATLMDESVDLVLAIGVEISEWSSHGWSSSALLNDKLVHIDTKLHHFRQTPMARLHVQADIQELFNRIVLARKTQILIDKDNPKTISYDTLIKENAYKYFFTMEKPEQRHDESTPIKPQRLMHELPQLFPPKTRYVVDPGNSQTWAIHHLHPHDRRLNGHRDAKAGLFQSSLEYASMGWAIGNAIGVAIANIDTPVVCLCGDGSFLMSGQEITVALQEKLTVVFIILNDSALGMVKHGQRLAEAEETAFQLPEINFADFAESMGIKSHIVESPEDLLRLPISDICKRRGPTLIDVRIDAEEVPPMAMRMQVLGSVKG